MKTSALGYVRNEDVIEILDSIIKYVTQDSDKYFITMDSTRRMVQDIKKNFEPKDNMVSMAELKGDATLWSPLDALAEGIRELGKDSETRAFNKDTKKVLVLALDNEGDKYDISFLQAGMYISECITLCEVAKTTFLRQMGHLE